MAPFPRPARPVADRRAILFVAVALAPIAALTLAPTGGAAPSGFDLSICLPCGATGSASALLNVLLFMPLGAALAFAGYRAGVVTVIGLLVSAAIEAAQMGIPGRHPVLGDIVTNGLGAGLGAHAWIQAARWLAASSARSWLATAAASATVLATAPMIAPAWSDSVYYGHWTARLGHLAWYRGRVLSAEIGGLPLPSWRIEQANEVRTRLTDGVPLTVLALAGPPVTSLGTLFHLSDLNQRSQILLGPDGDDFVLRYRSRANVLGFDGPDVRLADALRGRVPGDTVRVTAQYTPDGFCLRVNEQAACPAPRSVGTGWAFLMFPGRLPPWAAHLLDLAWLAGLAAFACAWNPGWRRWPLQAAMLAAAAGVAAWWSPMLVFDLPAIAGLALGLAGGRIARVRLDRLRWRLPSAPAARPESP